MYGCAILEEPDYLCNLIGLQVLPQAASSDKDTSRTQNKRSISQEGGEESNGLWLPHANTFTFVGCLAFSFPLQQLFTSVPMAFQLK